MLKWWKGVASTIAFNTTTQPETVHNSQATATATATTTTCHFIVHFMNISCILNISDCFAVRFEALSFLNNVFNISSVQIACFHTIITETKTPNIIKFKTLRQSWGALCQWINFIRHLLNEYILIWKENCYSGEYWNISRNIHAYEVVEIYFYKKQSFTFIQNTF